MKFNGDYEAYLQDGYDPEWILRRVVEMNEEDFPLTLCTKARTIGDFIKDLKSNDPILLPLEVQEGGDHYKRYVIQPVEFAMSNKLDLCQANVVKYTVRFRDKGGIEDLRKARHYLELLAQFEYDAIL